MNQILPGLFVGNYWDSKDKQQLDKYKITHIISIHDCPTRIMDDKFYLCIKASDAAEQNLIQYFSICNDFIHEARLRGGNVLIHCLAGVSRSVTIAVAYIMSATSINWYSALKVVAHGREVANPNLGFQSQLRDFERCGLAEERDRLREKFPSKNLEESDNMKCNGALEKLKELQKRNSRYKGHFYISGDTEAGDDVGDKDDNGGPSISRKYNISFITKLWRTLPSHQKLNEAKPVVEHRASADSSESTVGTGEIETNVVFYQPIDSWRDTDNDKHTIVE